MHLVPFDQSVLCVDLWRRENHSSNSIFDKCLDLCKAVVLYGVIIFLIMALIIIINIFTLFTLVHFVGMLLAKRVAEIVPWKKYLKLFFLGLI
jgi:hypothetical protein